MRGMKETFDSDIESLFWGLILLIARVESVLLVFVLTGESEDLLSAAPGRGLNGMGQM